VIDEFKKETKKIKRLFANKRYFETVMIGVQLLVKISESISEWLNDMAEDKMDTGSAEYKGWKKVYDIYQNSLRKITGDDAPRAKILGIFFDVVNHEGFQSYTEREVVSLMHKVERVVSFRNNLAHHYHDNPKIKKNLPIRASECLDLLSAITFHPWF